MSDPAPRRRRLRFSLRSLILFITLIAAATGLWYRWEPWILERTFKGSYMPVAFSPDQTRFVCVGRDNTDCWDINTGKKLWSDSKVSSRGQFSPDGLRYSDTFGAGQGPRVHIRDAATGQTLYRRDVKEVSSETTDENFRVLLHWGDDGGVVLLRIETEITVETLIPAPADTYECVVSPDGQQAVTWNLKGDARVWDVKSAEVIQNLRMFPVEQGEDPADFAYSADGTRLRARSMKSPVRLWNTITWERIDIERLRGGEFCCSGSLVGWGYNEELVFLDGRTGQFRLRTDLSHPDHSYNYRDQRLSPNARFSTASLSTTELSGTVLLEVPSGRMIGEFVEEHFPHFAPDEERLLLFHYPPELNKPNESPTAMVARLRELQSGVLLAEFDCLSDEAVFSTDGRMLALGRHLSYSDELNSCQLYLRRRPEYWYGVAWLPEFWLTLVLAGALVFSLWCESRIMQA